MSLKEPMTPRDAYQAYLKGDLTPAQAEKAVQKWYAAVKPGTSKPAQDG